ncbi:hypothetical protein D3C85_1630670 [compost metagenome]
MGATSAWMAGQCEALSSHNESNPSRGTALLVMRCVEAAATASSTSITRRFFAPAAVNASRRSNKSARHCLALGCVGFHKVKMIFSMISPTCVQ